MGINALMAKVIFDKNPNHEFFVEESLPLEWMYPHLTPHGVIMKVNRQPLPSISEDILGRDHEFWKQYSHRLTGDIIDYDTSVQQVARWIEKTYVRYDFEGFTGDRKFIHDIDAQKSFSNCAAPSPAFTYGASVRNALQRTGRKRTKNSNV